MSLAQSMASIQTSDNDPVAEETPVDAGSVGGEEDLEQPAPENNREHEGFGSNLRRNRMAVTACFIGTIVVAVLFVGIVFTSNGHSKSSSSSSSSHLLDTLGDSIGFGTSRRTDFALVAGMTKSPDYDGTLNPTGNIHLLFDDDNHFLLSLHMSGLNAVCNGCSVKIHSHSDCSLVGADPGVPFWNHLAQRDNPWDRVRYFTEPDGTSHTSTAVYTGHGPEDLSNRVVLVYDREHRHAACGVLAPADLTTRGVHTLQTTLHNHPNYQNVPITGVVSVQFFPDDTFVVHMDLEGLPANCEHCQVGIQEGMDCHKAFQGSHFWNRSELDRDPFVVGRGAYYSSDELGSAERSFFLFNGYGYKENNGHAFILKDDKGNRIACGLLGPRLGGNGAGTIPPMTGQQ